MLRFSGAVLYIIAGLFRKSSFTSRMSTSRPILSVSPVDCLIDDVITIKVEGLNPNQPVTIATWFLESKRQWTSYAHYFASVDGNLDLHKATSVGGSYKGVDPMGLFWSVSVADDNAAELIKRDVTTPFMISVLVIKDHIKPTFSNTDTSLAQCTIGRRYMQQNVMRIPIEFGRIRGTLLLPKGSKNQQFPGIIDIYGATGGLRETRAALLASRGFVTFALAYFRYKDLPKHLTSYDLEYFEEAVVWLNEHPSVIKDQLGIIGLSKGAEIALHVSTITDKIKAVVAINSTFYTLGVPLSYKGVKIPSIHPDHTHIKTKDDWLITKDCNYNVPNIEDYFIQLEKSSSAEFLLIHGGDDEVFQPDNGLQLIHYLWNHGHKNAALHIYQGAGHIIEMSYVPVCKGFLHKLLGKKIYCGGEDALHAYAQKDAWYKVLNFFNTRLRNHVSKL